MGLPYSPFTPAMQSADPSTDAMGQLTPEQLHQYAQLGSLDDENAGLQEQLARARALRDHSLTMKNYNSVGSAALGGLADVINSIRGGAQEKDALARQQAIRGQQTQGREGFTQALINALRQRQQPASSPGDFSLPANGEGVG